MKFLPYILFFFSLQIWGQKSLEKPQTIDDYFFEAMNERLKENFEKSNEWFEKCLLISPENDVVFFKMAQNYFDKKDYDQSLIYDEKAKKYNPDNKWYQKLFIDIKIKQNTDKKTLLQLIKDFKKVADNPYVIKELIQKVYRQNKEKVKVTYSTPKPLKNNELKQLLQQKAYQELLKKAEAVLDAEPENVNAYLYMAKAYSALKKYDDALDYLDMGMDFVLDKPRTKKAFFQQYITIYTQLNKPKKARVYRQKLQKN